MTTPRTPTRNRRAEILRAAAELFAARGFHGVSIEDIGSAVGVSGPAIYRHFSGKEALLSEILLDISERLREQGARLVTAPAVPESPSGDAYARAALDALLHGHIDFALANPALIRVHERELDNVPESARRRIRRLQRLYVEEWVTVLSELYPDCPPARLRAATHAVFGLLNSTPRSAGELPPQAMAPLLHGMAVASLAVLA
ncbi:TetR family transcriptional regulator [Microtetraspora sp. AC03309]|uniref:TetR/AcrR family transcriptional regulator n=1 Tax=Microtetraspora sp. AC03309 TaxID=2779376 RepID=UPI001E2A2E31|nr:TetR/AcrR family transcriptional regulator [Microtetraspora sp. AC03309]MCC5581977.1 TetR family transcriptional regulator [Microtetraspora sp. AC03309]